jgi:hypothetical protein
MEEPGSSDGTGPGDADIALVEQELLRRLLLVASAAFVYRERLGVYLARQAELVEGGKTVDELIADGWELFEEVARAEQRLFAALDELDRQS